MAAGETSIDLDATERWLIRRGTPHLIVEYNAAEDIFTRAAPALILIFLLSMFGAGNVDWSWWLNTIAVIGGFAVLVGVWAVANRLRRRRLLALPTDIGWAELSVFVIGPSLLQVLNGQLGAALATATTLIALLVLLYMVTSYGLVPMTRWALVETARELQTVFGLLLRALPLLLLVVTFLFINAEVWDVSGNLSGPFFALVVGLFASIGMAFLVFRLPSEFDPLAVFDSDVELRGLVEGTPADQASSELLTATVAAGDLHLTTRQRINVVLVGLFSQGLQIVVVSLMIGAFFVLLGTFAVTGETIERWIGHPGDVLATFELWGQTIEIHRELLKTSAFLAAFSALHFTVTSITDETYRREFLDGVLSDLRQAFAVRAVYAEAYRQVGAETGVLTAPGRRPPPAGPRR